MILKEKLTQAQKDANDKQWYKDHLDRYDYTSGAYTFSFNGIDDKKRKDVNYNLMNNIINTTDFEYVCKPYGANAGELPANMTNRDIVSGKINALLGWEMKRPFTWRVASINPEAVSRREQEEQRMLREYVVAQIMTPIRAEMEAAKMQQLEGRTPTQEDMARIQKEIEAEMEAKTPPEVRKYITRDFQDTVEIMGQRILNYLFQEDELPNKFNRGFFHGLISGEEVYYIDTDGDDPKVRVINTKHFDCDRSTDTPYVHERQWAGAEYYLSPEEIVARWGDELSGEDINDLYEMYSVGGSALADSDFTFLNTSYDDTQGKIRCVHKAWRSLQKIGFLTYIDENGQQQERIVSEQYKINKMAGDISIEWQWIPQTHEAIRIGRDKYVRMRPVPHQMKDVNNLLEAPLPFVGVIYSDVNSVPVSLMDRLKSYQYYYNIIMYRIEVLMATDMGKFVVGNIKKIPRSFGIDITKFMYYAAANKVTWANPDEEGNRNDGSDVSQMFKEIDLSMVNQIKQYIDLAEYIERRAGESVGIPKQMEAQISASEAVTNVQQQLIQSSNILEPYFNMHNNVKKHVMQQLLETAKSMYSLDPPDHLIYTLDDMSLQTLTFGSNIALLDTARFGVFVTNSAKDAKAQDLIEQLAHAAMQTQTVDLADIPKIVRATNIAEAEEELNAARERKLAEQKEMERQRVEGEKELRRMDMEEKERQRKHELEMVKLKEKERRETELKKQAMFSMGFNENKDMDNDGVPDVLEIYRMGRDAEIENRKLDIEQQKVDVARKKMQNDAKKQK